MNYTSTMLQRRQLRSDCTRMRSGGEQVLASYRFPGLEVPVSTIHATALLLTEQQA
jgi:hypothetical protein